MSEITLNEQQAMAVINGRQWYKDFKNHKSVRQHFDITGPAGSGKTTIIYYIMNELGLSKDEVAFMALVGKATLVMTMNGTPAKTIHSTIYENRMVPVYEGGEIVLDRRGKPLFERKFVKREELDPRIKLLVVDEGSMVERKIAMDILSFGLPVIVLGDLNQLPPVFGASYFLSRPDITLTQVMRQALENPIIALSQWILQNGHKLDIKDWGEHCKIISKNDLTDEHLKYHDVVICGKNNTRDILNHHIRTNIYHITSELPVIGDKMICRKNNWSRSIDDNIYLVNGMTGFIEDIDGKTYNGKSLEVDFRPDFLEDDVFRNLKIDMDYLRLPSNQKGSYYSRLDKLEYGYAITCHLAQGSQQDKVLVYQENFGGWDFNKRWLYTAVTRAVEELTIVVD